MKVRLVLLEGVRIDVNKEKPLPKPRKAAFGRKKQFGQEEGQDALLADRLAAAMAEGKLEEFLKQEMPDNEYARSLATMMMGMTGMMPPADAPAASHAPENRRSRCRRKTRFRVRHLQKGAEVGRIKKRSGGDVRAHGPLRRYQKRMPDLETKPAGRSLCLSAC
jgi:hypothetical protein